MDAAKYTNGTAGATIKTGQGTVYGIIVNSHTSGTFKLWDNTAGSGTVITNTFTLAAAGSQVVLFPAPISFYTGLFMDVGGTIDYTVIWK